VAAGGVRADDQVGRARAEVEARKERVAWAERMVKMKYLAETQLRAERARLADAEVALLKAQADRRGPEGGLLDRLSRLAVRALVAQQDVERARADLEMARERAAWSARMVKQGYMSPVQAEAERSRAAAAADRLRKATDALKAVGPAGPEKK